MYGNKVIPENVPGLRSRMTAPKQTCCKKGLVSWPRFFVQYMKGGHPFWSQRGFYSRSFTGLPFPQHCSPTPFSGPPSKVRIISCCNPYRKRRNKVSWMCKPWLILLCHPSMILCRSQEIQILINSRGFLDESLSFDLKKLGFYAPIFWYFNE